MKTRSKRGDRGLKSVVVTDGRKTYVGFLLFKTSKFVVLLNNVLKATDVGPLRRIRKEQVEPECDIVVLPRSPDMTVEFLKG
jgi:hypothetical protein